MITLNEPFGREWGGDHTPISFCGSMARQLGLLMNERVETRSG